MSAELIAAWFWTRGTKTLDVEAAKAAVDTVSEQELQRYWQHATGDGFDSSEVEDVREVKTAILAEIDEIATLLPDEHGHGQSRDGLAITSPSGDTLWFAGGTSWGDDPNQTFTAMSNLLECPTVLKALRGAGDWSTTEEASG